MLSVPMWELVSFAQGRARKLCLQILEQGPKTPNSIAKSSEIYLSHISRALHELEEKSLVECLTPKLPKNRIYEITAKGKIVLGKLRDIE